VAAAAIAAVAAPAARRQQDVPPLPVAPVTLPSAPSQAAVGPIAPRYPARPSRALGRPTAGRLVRGVQLPVEGPDHLTWDPALDRLPDRPWRRWGTDRLVRVLLRVLSDYRYAHPDAPRVLIGDLSRPHGGEFGARFGGLGHASHQNGLDADLYYPRRDGLPRPPLRPSYIDHALAADLVARFVEAGARYVFVGPHTGLRGPRKVVQPLRLHDDHMHVRLWP
jgi:murein endopeptidase